MLENVNGFDVKVADYVIEAGGITKFVRREVAVDEKEGFHHLHAMSLGWNSPVILAEIEKNDGYLVLELGQTDFVEGSNKEDVRYVVDFVLTGEYSEDDADLGKDGQDEWIEQWELADLDRVESELMEILRGNTDHVEESRRLGLFL